MKESFERELAVFSTARELPAAARATYLDRACADDAALRGRVEELLQASGDAESFLQDYAPGVQRPEASSASVLDASLAAHAEKPGDRIGRYKLLQQIGEGGCGVVYMAEQEEPVRRHVALKVIKLGMDTKSVIARFEAERQALAMMDHPGIAKVLDAGATDTGRPYFVMELVRGTKITEFCDQKQLSMRERLGLFIEVCRAIQHAHQKGIIHRDIKPSNILVTLRDGVPVPKVIDFGIAKATTDQRLTDKTLFTEFAMFIGTPAYMSPEQAEMSELGIDTRSDIYSLGILLYELLTGTTPFDSRKLMKAGLMEIRRIIREEAPARPSTRLTTMAAGDLTQVAGHRQAEPTNLSSLVRGDLDWIVMKALDKDRARRYETASALAMDVQQHLNCEPVVARPPSRLYEFQKTVRRHKFGFAAAAALITLLAVGALVSTLEAIRATQAEREQAHLRYAAEAEAAKSRQVSEFLKDMLAGVGPSVALGRDTKLLREILDKTAERISRFTNQPQVEVEVRNTLGDVYGQLEELDNAEEMYREALRIGRNLPKTKGASVGASLGGLAWVLWQTQRYSEAESLAREALRICNEAPGDQSADAAGALCTLGASVMLQGRLAEAEPLIRAALAKAREAHDETREAEVANWLALVLRDRGRLAEAQVVFRDVVALSRKLYGAENPTLAYALNNLADTLRGQQKFEEAEPLVREALAMRKKLYGYGHTLVPQSIGVLLRVLQGEGKTAEAEATVLQALEEARKFVTNNPPVLELYLEQAANELATNLKFAPAEVLRREALAGARLSATNDPARLEERLTQLAGGLRDQGKFVEAEPLAQEALVIARQLATTDPARLEARLADVGSNLRSQNRHTDAEPPFREALTIARRLGTNNPLTLAWRLFDLGSVLRAQNKFAQAEPLLREAQARVRQLDVSEPALLEFTSVELGYVLQGQHRFLEAEPYFRQALAKSRQVAATDPSRLDVRLVDVAYVLRAQEKYAEAETFFREAETNARRFWTNDPARLQVRLNDVVDILQRQGKMAELEQYFDTAGSPSIPPGPCTMALLNSRVECFARRGRWRQAAGDATQLVALAPTNHFYYHRLAPLLVRVADVDGYRAHCQHALRQFRATEQPLIAERMAKDCLLLPDSGVDMRSISQWADTALSPGKPSDDLPWFELCKGLAEYRSGQFASALDWSKKAMSHPGGPPERDLEACLILAMAQYRFAQPNEARATLDKGIQIAQSKLPTLESGDLGGQWIDWLIAHALLDEAKVLIEGQPATRKN